jgi:alkyl sulfatase BDS1-like metallo-beta-lactamase superfamily hydrolase
MSLDAHIVSLQTLFDSELAGDFETTIELRLGEDRFRIAIAGGQMVAERGEAAAPDATIETDPSTLIALVHGHRELREVLKAGDADIDGDRQAVERFVGLFPLPAPAA